MASDDVIEWLAGLEREATPGPWTTEPPSTSYASVDVVSYDGALVADCGWGHTTDEADARLIATLRTVAPELLAVVRASLAAEACGVMVEHEHAELRMSLDALRVRLEEVRRG